VGERAGVRGKSLPIQRARPFADAPRLRHSLAFLLALFSTTFITLAQTNQPIDLPTALRLAGAQNLDVQIARERLREAEAQRDAAVYNFFPWVTPGVGYRRHDGRIQDIVGTVFDASKQQLTPGATLEARLELGESWFKVLAARQLAKAADHAADAQQQETITAAALGYFELVKARATADVAQEAARVAGDYADQLQRGVELGLIFKGDALRARGQSERNQLTVQQAREQQRIAAARLAQLLRLDPAVTLVPADNELLPLTLTATNAALDSLVAQALGARPELKQGTALTAAAAKQHDAVTVGPLFPTLGAQAFVGALGGGRNNDMETFGGSANMALTLGWRFGPGGIFDSAREKTAQARLTATSLAADKVKDEIIRQVVEAHTRVHSLASQLTMLRRALATAEEAFRLTRERKERGFGVVLENIFAEQELTRARSDYVAAVAEFNKAQYGLRRATGQMPGE
jgi:outer membrane protein TolC